MATESDVDIRSAHPYWAYPYNDIAVVHNGQITNYWLMRRQLERNGQRFVSNCDSELLAVYTAVNLEKGMTLEDSLQRSIHEIDGVFTYLITTRNELGMAKDTMAAKPMVLYEADDMVALASEEVAIRAIIRTRSTPPTPMTRRFGYGRRERLRFHADGHAYRAPDGPGHQDQVQAQERRRFRLPLRADVDFNRRAEIDCAELEPSEINRKIRDLMDAGHGSLVLRNPGAKHSLIVGILNRMNFIVEGSLAISAAGCSTARMSGFPGASAGRSART